MDCEEEVKKIEELKVNEKEKEEGQLQVTCFSEVFNDGNFHFQIIRLPKQIYVWIGYNSAKLGHMYAAAHTRPNNMVSATSLLGGTFDNTGSGIARRLVLKTGLNIILACNLPKSNPMLEAEAEKILIQKLISLGISRSISDATPTHYLMRVQLFSLLAKNSIERYESGEFEAGGYKWKLVLYPSGKKSRNVKDHISLYLALDEASSLHPGWEIYVNFRLFLHDQNKDNYLVVQDVMAKERRFHKLKVEWGFDQFIPLKEFNDGSKGYLVDDVCAFGAEVFVCRERRTSKGESLVMVKDVTTYKHVWEVTNFSKLNSESCDSNPFDAGNYKWKIKLYPKGKDARAGSYLSLYLALADPKTLPQGSKIYAQIILRILDQKQAKHHIGKANYWFSASNHENGASKFILLSTFSSQYLVKDNCTVEAEVTILGMVDALS